MKLSITGRQMQLTDDLKLLFEKKLSKFDKFFRDDAKSNIVLSRKHGSEYLELTIVSSGTIFRAEEKADTFQIALDRAMDAIERQIRKNKTRLEKRLREIPEFNGSAEEDTVGEGEIIRVKVFPMKPMSAEEAVLQMNLLGHSFYVFSNIDAGGTTEVIYKRADGNYGLIVPEKP
ncbi:MAG: ribosome-associated translation inhibitor RaiA [Clostridia bacterium]|nr:ribosome-associated translation inhibitor RaiA [Clostridia bacterium]